MRHGGIRGQSGLVGGRILGLREEIGLTAAADNWLSFCGGEGIVARIA